jgi:hypothetical protein
MLRKVYIIVDKIPSDYWAFSPGPELPVGLVVHEYTGPTYGCIHGDLVAISLTPGQTPFYGIPSSAVEELIHLPELDANGQPTGHALCDIDGGLLAVPNAWRANCPDCRAEDDVANAVNYGPTDPAEQAATLADFEAEFPDDPGSDGGHEDT